MLTNTPKEQLGPLSLIFVITEIILKAKLNNTITDLKHFPSHISFDLNEENYEFHYPAQDTSGDDTCPKDLRELPQLLKTLKDRDVGPTNTTTTHLIPLVLTNRHHWTLLILKGRETTLIDTKIYRFYRFILGFGLWGSLDKMLMTSGYNRFKLISSGIQPDDDHIICGYTAAKLIDLILHGITPQEIEDATPELIDEWTQSTYDLPIPPVGAGGGILNAMVEASSEELNEEVSNPTEDEIPNSLLNLIIEERAQERINTTTQQIQNKESDLSEDMPKLMQRLIAEREQELIRNPKLFFSSCKGDEEEEKDTKDPNKLDDWSYLGTSGFLDENDEEEKKDTKEPNQLETSYLLDENDNVIPHAVNLDIEEREPNNDMMRAFMIVQNFQSEADWEVSDDDEKSERKDSKKRNQLVTPYLLESSMFQAPEENSRSSTPSTQSSTSGGSPEPTHDFK